MVMYAPVGKADRLCLTETVSRLGKLQPLESDNPAVLMAHERWNIIKPAYDAWKNGQNLPERGTPLAAWPGITSDQVEVLKMMGILSVEEYAEASDSIISAVPFPSARELRTAAKAFLAASDKMAVTTELKAKDEQIAALQADIEELKAALLSDAGDAPKRRGRPPKSEEAAA